MRIFVHHLDGNQVQMEIDKMSTVDMLVNSGCQLICQGTIINGLIYDQLYSQANVYVTSGLDGGKRKKKKKAHTTKKKNKHIHKKIKNLTLSLYSVENDKVTQRKKSCPSCGPGTFMASHWDRYYCGLCHITIKMDQETIKKNQEAIKIKKTKLEAERKAKEKQAAEKAVGGKGKKDVKKGKKK